MKKYKLLKDLPQLKKGAIFEHRDYDGEFPDRGNMGHGVMILSWLDGEGQQDWCGEAYIFQGQVAEDREWFEPIRKKKKEKMITIKVSKSAIKSLRELGLKIMKGE